MERDPLECNIIKNCAATLAGLGTAGIFNAGCPDRLCLEERLEELNRRLSPKGVMAEILIFRENTALIYVYRPSRLARRLEGLQQGGGGAADLFAGPALHSGVPEGAGKRGQYRQSHGGGDCDVLKP